MTSLDGLPAIMTNPRVLKQIKAHGTPLAPLVPCRRKGRPAVLAFMPAGVLLVRSSLMSSPWWAAYAYLHVEGLGATRTLRFYGQRQQVTFTSAEAADEFANSLSEFKLKFTSEAGIPPMQSTPDGGVTPGAAMVAPATIVAPASTSGLEIGGTVAIAIGVLIVVAAVITGIALMAQQAPDTANNGVFYAGGRTHPNLGIGISVLIGGAVQGFILVLLGAIATAVGSVKAAVEKLR